MSTPHTTHPAVWPLRFISVEAVSGLVLLAAAAIALACANSPLSHAYESLWQRRLSSGVPFLPAYDLRFWVNDGLMTVFFLLVGLEIRREIHDGTLSDPRVATLPIIAAAGGVLVPALLYLLVCVLVGSAPLARRGWAIPTATDIAFALGVLSLIGRVPAALRMLLLTLAIADDVAAILIIAFCYSGGIVAGQFLLVAAGWHAVASAHVARDPRWHRIHDVGLHRESRLRGPTASRRREVRCAGGLRAGGNARLDARMLAVRRPQAEGVR